MQQNVNTLFQHVYHTTPKEKNMFSTVYVVNIYQYCICTSTEHVPVLNMYQYWTCTSTVHVQYVSMQYFSVSNYLFVLISN